MELWRVSGDEAYKRIQDIQRASATEMAEALRSGNTDNLDDAEVAAIEYRILNDVLDEIETMAQEKSAAAATVTD